MRTVSKQITQILIKDEENNDNFSYNWEGSVESKSVKCVNIYGFTAEQIIDIEGCNKKIKKKGSRKSRNDKKKDKK